MSARDAPARRRREVAEIQQPQVGPAGGDRLPGRLPEPDLVLLEALEQVMHRRLVSGRGGRTRKRVAGRDRTLAQDAGIDAAVERDTFRIEMRPDLPSLKLPRIVSQGLAGRGELELEAASKRAGCRRQEGQLDALGGQVLAGRARPDRVAFGRHAPDGLDGQQADRPVRPAVDAPLACASPSSPSRPTRAPDALRHTAGRDVDLHDPPAAEWRWRSDRGIGFARSASWVSTMRPMLTGPSACGPSGGGRPALAAHPGACRRSPSARRAALSPDGAGNGRRLERVGLARSPRNRPVVESDAHRRPPIAGRAATP